MQRADQLILQLGQVQSRTHAQRLIKNKQVEFNTGKEWRLIDKPGIKLPEGTQFRIEAAEIDQYVSRGALKLKAALEHLQLDITATTALDIGQSTGGFTDCLLQAGAGKVVGVEVGHDQLAEKLRDDSRVICLEGMNARKLSSDLLEHSPEGFPLAVMDVSFISQLKILPSLIPLIADNGLLISLVKPQFEVGKEGISKGGIVRDETLYPLVEQSITEYCVEKGMRILDYLDSPIKGGDGNREFLLIAQKRAG